MIEALTEMTTLHGHMEHLFGQRSKLRAYIHALAHTD